MKKLLTACILLLIVRCGQTTKVTSIKPYIGCVIISRDYDGNPFLGQYIYTFRIGDSIFTQNFDVDYFSHQYYVGDTIK